MKISAKAGASVYEVVVHRRDGQYLVEIDGVEHVVDVQKLEGDFYTILMEGRSYEVSVEPDGDGYRVRHGAAEQRVAFSDPGRQARESRHDGDGPLPLLSMMPGKVVRVLVQQGDSVEAGQGVAVVEAMKMENEVTTPKAGSVRSVAVAAGQNVESGGVLMVIE